MNAKTIVPFRRCRGIVLVLACAALAPAVRAGTSVPLPFLSKAFSPAVIGAAGTTTLTFTLTNPAGTPQQTNVGFTDTLPTGLIVGNPPAVGGTCSNAAAVTFATAGDGTITVTNLVVPGGASCTVTVNVTNAEGEFNASCLSSPTAFTNTSANVTTNNVNNNVAASCVTVLVPTLSKAFLPTTINDGETTVLTFTLANPALAPATSIVGFTDTLPSGLVVANTTVGGTCANAAAATKVTAGDGTVTVSFLQVPAGADSCTVTVNVTNKPGQGNTSCAFNPTAFTNFAANLEAANAIVSSEPACLVVNGVAPPPSAEGIPAASPAALALLAGAVAAAGIFLARRRSS